LNGDPLAPLLLPSRHNGTTTTTTLLSPLPQQNYSSLLLSFKWLLPQVSFDELYKICSWDVELKRLLNLAIPFGLQGFTDGLFGLVVVAVIGHFLGPRPANAYIVVAMLTDLTNTINRGFYEGKVNCNNSDRIVMLLE
jgi:hypothetical protein